MKNYLILILCTLSSIYGQESTKKNKYFALPMDFTINNHGFVYGVNNKWEISLDFGIDADLHNIDKRDDLYRIDYYTVHK